MVRVVVWGWIVTVMAGAGAFAINPPTAPMAESPGTASEALDGVWPLRPRPEIVRGFAPPPSEYAAGHRGVDLRGRAGQPVRAALAGTVSFAGKVAGRGVVVVNHGETRTTYEPVDATVAHGDSVERGQAIGTLTPTESHCAPHACLHWGWRRGEVYLNPLVLVGFSPSIRLMPLGKR